MKINFEYDKEKDVWCLLNKGRSSNNSQNSTRQYLLLTDKYGENPTEEDAGAFVDTYISENKINIQKTITDIQNDWEIVSNEYQKRAETIFDTSLPHEITAYLTINSRCPYSIEDEFFYIYLQSAQARKTIMHELWHFYTWYGLGPSEEARIGAQKYNDIKESLTVLLNVECKDLLPEGVLDSGYPQHNELREKILDYWGKEKNIKNLWNYISE